MSPLYLIMTCFDINREEGTAAQVATALCILALVVHVWVVHMIIMMTMAMKKTIQLQ